MLKIFLQRASALYFKLSRRGGACSSRKKGLAPPEKAFPQGLGDRPEVDEVIVNLTFRPAVDEVIVIQSFLPILSLLDKFKNRYRVFCTIAVISFYSIYLKRPSVAAMYGLLLMVSTAESLSI